MNADRCSMRARTHDLPALTVAKPTTRTNAMVRTQMQLTMREAIKLAIADEMRADPSVVVFGEDVADAGGVFKVTTGLLEEFGGGRGRDTPIAGPAVIG